MSRPALMLAGAVALAAALPAQARNESHLLAVSEALGKNQSPQSRDVVRGLPLLFGSASAAGSQLLPGPIEAQGEASIVVDPRSRTPHLTDEEACQNAFEDAVAKLAGLARGAGAQAVVGIVSSFKGQRVDSATAYDCHSGASHSYVTLQASLARTYVPASTRALPPATGYAPLEDARAVPISDAGRERYAHFLTLPKPRAFVVYEDGGWRFYSKDPAAMTNALDHCAREGRRCWLYAVDDRVVWSADLAKRIGASSQLDGGAPSPAVPADDHQ